MAAEHEIIELLPSNEIQHIQRVRLQIYSFGEQVRALANACQGRCKYLVSLLLQASAYTFPAPAAVPGTMDQDKRGHR